MARSNCPARQFVVPAGGEARFFNVEIIIDAETQLDFDPTADITVGNISLQINGNHTLDRDSFATENTAIFRLIGALARIDSGQSLIITGTTTFDTFAYLHLVGGTFTTGALTLGGASDLILATGTVNPTNSNLEVGSGMPFKTELQGGTTDINVTNGDAILPADGMLSTNGSLTAIGLDNAGQVGTIGGSMSFSGPATNQATGQINAINAALNFNGGLTNSGALNLINTTVNGTVSRPRDLVDYGCERCHFHRRHKRSSQL